MGETIGEASEASGAGLRGWTAVSVCYLVAITVGVAVYVWLGDAAGRSWAAHLAGPAEIWRVLAADVAATVVVFLFSAIFRNASFYDPYWSVAPIVIGVAWLPGLSEQAGDPLRAWVLWSVVLIWGVRLTYNWASGWGGLHHEDWRYIRLRRQTGWWYPAVNFLGIHLFPTLLVWLGLWSLWAGMSAEGPMVLWEWLAAAATLGFVVLEAVADLQLRRFVDRGARCEEGAPEGHGVMDEGVWGWCRHPNYLGELGLWWGLFACACAAGAFEWWLLGGPLAMTGLFAGISIPMMEARQRRRRPAYRDYMERVPMLLPFRLRRRD